MNAKHTPGPWKMSPPLGPGDLAVVSKKVNAGGNFHVALIPNAPHAEAEANARLIAAAPALLEALEAILAGQLGGNVDTHAERFTIALAAIAAARGE